MRPPFIFPTRSQPRRTERISRIDPRDAYCQLLPASFEVLNSNRHKEKGFIYLFIFLYEHQAHYSTLQR